MKAQQRTNTPICGPVPVDIRTQRGNGLVSNGRPVVGLNEPDQSGLEIEYGGRGGGNDAVLHTAHAVGHAAGDMSFAVGDTLFRAGVLGMSGLGSGMVPTANVAAGLSDITGHPCGDGFRPAATDGQIGHQSDDQCDGGEL